MHRRASALASASTPTLLRAFYTRRGKCSSVTVSTLLMPPPLPTSRMLRSAISRLGARLRHHADPLLRAFSTRCGKRSSLTADPLLRAFSTRCGMRSSLTVSPADSNDEGPLRGLFVLSSDPECPPRLLVQLRLSHGSLLDSKREFGPKGAPPHLDEKGNEEENPRGWGEEGNRTDPRRHTGVTIMSPWKGSAAAAAEQL